MEIFSAIHGGGVDPLAAMPAVTPQLVNAVVAPNLCFRCEPACPWDTCVMDDHYSGGGTSLLHEAAVAGNTVLMERLLAAGGQVNLSNFEDETPLHAACRSGREKLLKLLVASGGDTDARDCEGNTALMLACEEGHIEIAKFLIKANAASISLLNHVRG